MTFDTVLPIWQAISGRFIKMVKGLAEADLSLKLGEEGSTIGYLIRHNAEVEYMLAEWYLGKPIPAEISADFSKSGDEEAYTNLDELVAYLEASSAHVVEALRALPEESWTVPVEGRMGPSTPLEAVGRLMYHTGIHSGQISLIKKHA